MTNLIHVPSTLPVLVYNRKPAPNLMVCCNAKAGQKIWSMLPSFRRVAFHDNVVSAIPGRANTFCILTNNGSHSLMETHTHTRIVEQNHHARVRRIDGPV